jgi:hypothetical protein
MASILFLVFGFVDLLAGLVLILSTGLFLGDIMKIIGWALIGKGIWTIITGLSS